MPLQKLQHAMESFYLSTHLSICAIDQDKQLLLATGASQELIDFIKQSDMSTNDLFGQLVHFASSQLDHFQTTNHLVYAFKENVLFSICPLSPNEPHLGFYIIGPYTNDLHLKNRYLYKPDHCIKPLIDLLYTFSQMPLASENIEYAPSSSNFHINKALAYIDAHAHEALSLSDLADYLSINKSYLCTLFKKSTNDCFSTYLNKVRIEKSKALLANTNESILDIALQVGFSNASYYHTLFKKLTGVTPLMYRQQNQD